MKNTASLWNEASPRSTQNAQHWNGTLLFIISHSVVVPHIDPVLPVAALPPQASFSSSCRVHLPCLGSYLRWSSSILFSPVQVLPLLLKLPYPVSFSLPTQADVTYIYKTYPGAWNSYLSMITFRSVLIHHIDSPCNHFGTLRPQTGVINKTRPFSEGSCEVYGL